MIRPADIALPPPPDRCGVTVVIPARNEERTIGAALAAFAAQRDPGGARLAAHRFDVIVLANNCTDETAALARRIAAQTSGLRVFVVEATFDRAQAHIGTARKFGLDLAAGRFLAAGRPAGVIASIDSDTLADSGWVAAVLAEMEGRDAVAGAVTISAADQARLVAPVRLLYARELAYRRTLAQVQALLDPLPEDPAPRHIAFVGASFAVRADTYVAAGGLPPLRRLEDQAFGRALQRVDAKVRHSSLMRATTSTRRNARVAGGFGTFLTELHDCARNGTSHSVEHPSQMLGEFEVRAALRRIWRNAAQPTDIARVSALLGLPARAWLQHVDRLQPLGTVYEQIVALAETARTVYPWVPVERATDALQAAAQAALRRRTSAAGSAGDPEGKTG